MNPHDTMDRLRAARPTARETAGSDGLLSRIVAEPGDPRLGRGSGRRSPLVALRHPRLLAGGSLGVAGIAAAAVVVFSGGAAVSGGTAAPASASVTREASGGVLVHLPTPYALTTADYQLQNMGVKEQVDNTYAPGPATSSAPIACQLVLGPGDTTPAPSSAGPKVSMSLGTDGSGTIPSSAGNTGGPTGTVHLASCISYPEGPGTQLGNSGYKFLRHYGHHGA